jgi:hypothetical protein
MHHLPELFARDPLFAFALLIDEMHLLGDVARAEKQHTFARQSVASARPFLIITLDILRQIAVATNRTFGLLMPMPNAMVAAITRTSSRRNSSWFFVRSAAVRPA